MTSVIRTITDYSIRSGDLLYLRFTLSLRDVEDLLAERGIRISYETVRRWVNHFGPLIAADLRKRRPKPLLGIWARVRHEGAKEEL